MRTIPIIMTDGYVHGVHLWTGPPKATPPQCPRIGAVVWDLNSGLASDTRDALLNGGLDPDGPLEDRAFADDLTVSDVHSRENAALALAVSCHPGNTFCDTWDLRSRHDGELITVNFVAHALLEQRAADSDHLIIRAMNWRSPRDTTGRGDSHLAQRILRGLARPGEHRVLVDLTDWRLLKWLDPPSPDVDWRSTRLNQPFVHPDDSYVVSAITSEFANGPAEGLLRLRSPIGWRLMHLTVYRVELTQGVFAGLVSLRIPTADEESRGIGSFD